MMLSRGKGKAGHGSLGGEMDGFWQAVSASLQISMGENAEINFQWSASSCKLFATRSVIALVSIAHLTLHYLTSVFTTAIAKFPDLKQTEK